MNTLPTYLMVCGVEVGKEGREGSVSYDSYALIGTLN